VPRAGLSQAAVVDTALSLVDEGGLESVTLAAVAQRAGVATPSLYRHVASLAELRRLLALRVLDEITDLAAEAVLGRSGDEAVAALMTAYRRYVQAHPNRYAIMPQQPLTDPVLAASGERLMGVLLAVLRQYDLSGPDAIHAARRLRAAVHGFVSLEAAGGFGLPEDLDASFASLIEMVTASLRASGPSSDTQVPGAQAPGGHARGTSARDTPAARPRTASTQRSNTRTADTGQ
jgi:AcrR family transcriptional regulator